MLSGLVRVIRYGRRMSLRYTVTVPLEIDGMDDQAAVQALQEALAREGTDIHSANSPSLSRPVGEPGAAVTAYLEVTALDRCRLDSCISAVLDAVHDHGITRAGAPTIIAIRANRPQFDLIAGDDSDL